ncbi:MAG: hypothetical protein HY562_09110 [Ignavibacteriales bacterium]|nr:hypothetical protein [Ignavibacteriales bacterium]
MNSRELMNQKVELLLDEISRINVAVIDAMRKVDHLDYKSPRDLRLLELKERLSVIQARIEGLGEFVNECSRLARERDNPHPQDIDIWV